jgi:hypothetical protein
MCKKQRRERVGRAEEGRQRGSGRGEKGRTCFVMQKRAPSEFC